MSERVKRFALGGSVVVRGREAEGRRHLVNINIVTNEVELHAPVAGTLHWPVGHLEDFNESDVPIHHLGAPLLIAGKERAGVVTSYGLRGYDFDQRTLRVNMPGGSQDAVVPWDSVHPAATWVAAEVAKLNELRGRRVRAEHVARLCVRGSDGSVHDRDLLRTLLDEESQAAQESEAAEEKSGWVRNVRIPSLN